MIDETMQRVQKEIKLVLTERTREENTLTTDLWKKTVSIFATQCLNLLFCLLFVEINTKIMKEEFTINKPHIANEFSGMLYQILEADSARTAKEPFNNIVYTVKENDLKKCLIKLGNMVQERERTNFEQYTMFYENLLRLQHQVMYSKERQVDALKNSLAEQQASVNVEVQTQMADVCYDLIMEITALRSKMNEINETREHYGKEIRDKIKGEFIDLVTDLVSLNSKLKSQLDEFK